MLKKHGVITALLMLPSTLVWAQVSDVSDLSIGIFAEYEDNPRRTDPASKEETITGLNSNLSLDWTRRLYDLNLDYGVEYAHYNNDTFDDKTSMRGSGTLLLGSDSSPIRWLINNSQQQVLRGSSSNTRPTAQNTAQRSSTRTGPIAKFDFAGTETIQARYLYSIYEIEDSDFDIESWTSSLSWHHRFSRLASAKLSAQSVETELKDFDNLKFQTDRVSLEFTRIIKEGVVSAQLGQARSSRELSSDVPVLNSSSDLNLTLDQDFKVNEFQISFAKKMGGHSFNFELQRTQSDSTRGLEAEFDNLGFDIGEQQFSLQKRTRADLRWTGPSFIPLTSYTFAFTQSQSEDATSENTDDASRASLNLNRRLSTRTQVGLTLSYSDFQSEQAGGQESDRQASEAQLNYTRKLTQSTSLACDLRYQESKGRFEFDNTAVRCSFNAKIF